MKKLTMLFVAMFVTCAMCTAQEKSYVIQVTYSITIEYRDMYGHVLSSQSGGTSTQSFPVCAENEGQARAKAIDQCSSTCNYGGQRVGSAEIGGEKCDKYEVRRVTGAKDVSIAHPDC